MEPGATRLFANVIHEFAQSIGKENFYVIGEVTGGRARAVNTVDTTGIDAALGIDDIQDKLEFLIKGERSPGNPQSNSQEGYFDLFRNSLQDDKSSHQWYAKHIVVMFDDHDQVGATHKFRFCDDRGDSYRLLRAALGINLTTAGIPCIYYGTEQGFNGTDHRTGDRDEDKAFSDVFLRECMFGGPFGSLQSTGRHFFNEDHEVFRFVQKLCELRRQHMTLRRGRQYLRQVSESGAESEFYYPQPLGGRLQWVIGWSRIFAEREYLCAANTDSYRPITVWVTVDHGLQPAGKQMVCLLSTDAPQVGGTTLVESRNGSAIRITVPPAGFVVYH
jgi:glycosidase